MKPRADAIARPRVSYLQDVWRRFRQNKMALIALIILTILIVMVLIGPAISGYEFEEVDKTARNMGPSASHWFGTDKLGRDLFARVWQGGRVSILIGLVGALVSAVIGCLYGGIAAYFGGIVDDVMMRILEVIISIPYLIVVILLSVVLESKSVGTLILAMTIAGWCQTAPSGPRPDAVAEEPGIRGWQPRPWVSAPGASSSSTCCPTP